MPDATEQLAALADVYANALLEAADAKGEGAAQEVSTELAELIRYMDSEPSFATFLTTASVDATSRRASLEKLFRGKMSETLLNLLQVLNNRDRLAILGQVQRCVERRMQQRNRQQEVLVETAMPLSDEVRNQLKDRIGQYMGKEPLLQERVVPELIGGVVIHIGDEQIDGSVIARIRGMQRGLQQRVNQEIYSGRGYDVA